MDPYSTQEGKPEGGVFHGSGEWNTETGEEALLPRYQAVSAINSPNSAGTGYRWTSRKDQAPEPRENTVRCFLHPESPERELLDDLGVSVVCLSAHLASNASKWTHARNRHKAAFDIYQLYQAEQKEQQAQARADKQLEATLEIARGRGKAKGE